jgi:hypothetical protein
MKILLGQNMVKTSVVKKYQKEFSIDIEQAFYYEKNDNKMVFAIYDDESGDEYKGVGLWRVEENKTEEVKVRL